MNPAAWDFPVFDALTGKHRALTIGLREHFLAVAIPENVARMKSLDPSVFVRADYGRSYSVSCSYASSAIWTWLVWRDEEPSMLPYNDV